MTEGGLVKGLPLPLVDREPPSIMVTLWAYSTPASEAHGSEVTAAMWPAAAPEDCLYESSEHRRSFYLSNEYLIKPMKQSALRC